MPFHMAFPSSFLLPPSLADADRPMEDDPSSELVDEAAEEIGGVGGGVMTEPVGAVLAPAGSDHTSTSRPLWPSFSSLTWASSNVCRQRGWRDDMTT